MAGTRPTGPNPEKGPSRRTRERTAGVNERLKKGPSWTVIMVGVLALALLLVIIIIQVGHARGFSFI